MPDAIFISEGDTMACPECLKRVSDAEFGFSVGSLLFMMKTLFVVTSTRFLFSAMIGPGLLEGFEWEY